MDVKISPHSLSGSLSAITSKSDAHRAFICASLAESKTKIRIDNTSKDIDATISCIEAMGGKVERDGCFFIVSPISRNKISPVLDCNESGSTLRFLFPLANLVCKNPTFIGKGRLPERPLSELCREMVYHGCEIFGDTLPLTTNGRIRGGTYRLAGNISSQFVSGLLFSLPLCEEDSKIILTSPLQSKGYVNMTLATLKLFGIEICEAENEYIIKGNQKYISPKQLAPEGDWSNSAFWLCAGAMNGEIKIDNLNFDSFQGDKQIITILESFGAKVSKGRNDVHLKTGKLSKIQLDCTDIPDLVPIISAVAAVSDGQTILTGVERLKIKESDRLKAVTETLSALGADVYVEGDSRLVINGKTKLKGGKVYSFNDHRIAMMAAIAGTVCSKDVIICGAEAVEKSYPDFFEHYRQLGGVFNVI